MFTGFMPNQPDSNLIINYSAVRKPNLLLVNRKDPVNMVLGIE